MTNLNLTTDIRPLIRLSVSVIVGDDKNKEMGSFGGGGRRDLNYFDDKIIKEYAKKRSFSSDYKFKCTTSSCR